MSSSGPAVPRRGRPGHDQAAVLQRAIEVFNRRGYDGTSIADLAAELGVGKSAIYHHVPSKEHLLAAALDEALLELEAAVGAATCAAGPPGPADPAAPSNTATERLREVVRESVRILVDHLPAVTLLLRVRGNSEVEQSALRRRRAVDEQLAGLVSEAAAEGGVRDDVDPELASRLLFGMVNSLAEWYDPEGPVDPRDLADAVAEVAFGGLERGTYS